MSTSPLQVYLEDSVLKTIKTIAKKKKISQSQLVREYLYRQIKSMGNSCKVAASSLVPQRHGDMVNNDRRDARKPVRHLRNAT